MVPTTDFVSRSRDPASWRAHERATARDRDRQQTTLRLSRRSSPSLLHGHESCVTRCASVGFTRNRTRPSPRPRRDQAGRASHVEPQWPEPRGDLVPRRDHHRPRAGQRAGRGARAAHLGDHDRRRHHHRDDEHDRADPARGRLGAVCRARARPMWRDRRGGRRAGRAARGAATREPGRRAWWPRGDRLRRCRDHHARRAGQPNQSASRRVPGRQDGPGGATGAVDDGQVDAGWRLAC